MCLLKRIGCLSSWLIFGMVHTSWGLAEEPLRVVATTRTFASLIQTVGGDFVKVDYVAASNQNVHFVQPRPSDVLRLSKADLFVHAGLDLELWRFPLAEASGNPEFLTHRSRELNLSQGIVLLGIPEQAVSRAQGDIHIYGNPHYWLNPENGKVMAKTIHDKLAQMDSAHAGKFSRNLESFLTKLDQKIAVWRRAASLLKGLPVIAYHDSWPYLAEFTGFQVVGFVEPLPGIPPTPQHVKRLLEIVRKEGVRFMIQESYFEDRTAKKIAKQTNTRLLTFAQGVGENEEVTDYLALFDYNIRVLTQAVASGG